MDDDSDTAFSILNNHENSDIRFYDVLINTREGKSAFKRFFICAFFALLTIISALVPNLSYALEIFLKAIFCLCAMLTGFRVYARGFSNIVRKKPSAYVLCAVCTLLSYAFTVVTGLHWFESGIVFDNDFCFIIPPVVMTGMLFGDFIKNGLKNRSNDAVDRLCEFLPENIDVSRCGQTVNVAFEYVRKGDCTRVLPGEKIPFDAVVTEGDTTVDESALTGEDIPVSKKVGSKVFAGSINKYGEITIKSICNGDECLIYRLIRMAKRELKNEFERNGITERAVGVYFLVIILISLAVIIINLVLGLRVFDAVAIGIMVLLLSCPVAVAFVEPVLSLMIITWAYKDNILIQNPNVVAVLKDVNIFAFDKSGTLTMGEYVITDVHILNDFSEKEIFEYAASVESVTDHPISDAIFEYAFEKGITAQKVDNLEKLDNIVKAVIDGNEVCFGDYLAFEADIFDEYKSLYEKLKKDDKTIAVITVNSQPAAIIAAKDLYKPGAVELMKILDKNSIETMLLTDDYSECDEIIKNENTESFPDVKAEKIKSVRLEGKTVAMVGDGINDTVALITSDVGISVGSATTAALEASDIIIASDNIADITKMMMYSKLYNKKAKQNIILSYGFNFILLICTFFTGFFGMKHLSEPVLLTAALSVLTVILNTWHIKNK